MTLSKHIDTTTAEREYLKLHPKVKLSNTEDYIFKYSSNVAAPKRKIPDNSAPKEQVYRYLQEELSLDGTPNLNLASFVNTEVDETHLKLINLNITKNLADNDEYPSLLDFQQRCILMLSNMWHAPRTVDPHSGEKVTSTIGALTTGSSEAVMLAGLALKKRWQEKRKAAGKSTENPNILMATCAQVALEKFARYFDVEDRLIPICKESGHLIDVSKIKENIDENTIGIFVILGLTFTGAFEPVEEISKLLDTVQEETGHDVRIHVDGASGAFIAPFAHPHLKWDFAIPRVDSINTSGHKFGLTTAGLGWVVWKDEKLLPQSLKFSLDYLGGVEETFGLNFSRPGFPVVSQYYNFVTLGREGYTKIAESCISNARLLLEYLVDSQYFDVISVIHKKISPEDAKRLYTRDCNHEYDCPAEEYYPGLPVVAFTFSESFKKACPTVPQSILSYMLRNKGFIVPNYRLPPNENQTEILRVVVRNTLSLNLLEKLMEAINDSARLLLNATQDIKKAIGGKFDSEEAEAAALYDMLLSIASGGGDNYKQAQHEHLSEKTNGAHDNRKTFRGPC